MSETPAATAARRVKELRLARGLTQEKLAQRSGLTKQTIYEVESGKSPRLDTLVKLATALEVPVAQLLTEDVA